MVLVRVELTAGAMPVGALQAAPSLAVSSLVSGIGVDSGTAHAEPPYSTVIRATAVTTRSAKDLMGTIIF